MDIDGINGTIVGTIEPDSEDQTIEKCFSLRSEQHCLFADVQYRSNVTRDYTFLKVHTGPRYGAGIGITVSMLLVLLLLVLIMEIILYLSFRNYRAKETLSKDSNRRDYETLALDSF